MEYQKVLLRPLITEKTTILQDEGKYAFEIAKKANKISVKEAVTRTFGVTVVDVNICITRGKVKRFGPKPHKYKKKVNKKVKQLARRSILSQKVAQNNFMVLDNLSTGSPKTSEFFGGK